ncbi:MAG: trigger factor [Mycoplasmataceae bacterium]|nr:trigger factor [Mycoplasmataceae bacterium]
MKILNVDKGEKTTTIHVEITPSVWQNNIEKAKRSAAINVKIPGFRAGKAPYEKAKDYLDMNKVINKALKPTIKETMEEIDKEDEAASKENKLNCYLDENCKTDVVKLDLENLECKFTLENEPIVTLPDIKDLTGVVSEKDTEATKEEIDQMLNTILEQEAMLVKKESGIIENNDVVVMDFKGFDKNNTAFEGGEGKDYEITVGSKKFIPGFEEQMVGLKAGEEKTIDVKFPEDYHAKELAGQDVKFELKIKSVKTKVLPKLDEDFFQSHKRNDIEINSEADLRALFAKEISVTKLRKIKETNSTAVRNWILKYAKVSYLPQSLLNEQLVQLDKNTKQEAAGYLAQGMSFEDYLTNLCGITTNQYIQNLSKISKDNLTILLVFSKFMEEFKIEIANDEKDLDFFIKEMTSMDPSLTSEEINQELANNPGFLAMALMQYKVIKTVVDMKLGEK